MYPRITLRTAAFLAQCLRRWGFTDVAVICQHNHIYVWVYDVQAPVYNYGQAVNLRGGG
jgi:N6-adenosine-specific RNA methylase IME4